MKKKIVITCILAISSMLSFAQKVTDNLEGNWKTPEGKIIVVSKTSEKGLSGVVQNKNITVLKDVLFSNGKWQGRLVKPNDGSEVKCELRLDQENLVITAKKGMFSKELIWKRP